LLKIFDVITTITDATHQKTRICKRLRLKYIFVKINFMLSLRYSNTLECGTDEAGRGCLTDPVAAAAAISLGIFFSRF
jgi:hypothetical protein